MSSWIWVFMLRILSRNLAKPSDSWTSKLARMLTICRRLLQTHNVMQHRNTYLLKLAKPTVCGRRRTRPLSIVGRSVDLVTLHLILILILTLILLLLLFLLL